MKEFSLSQDCSLVLQHNSHFLKVKSEEADFDAVCYDGSGAEGLLVHVHISDGNLSFRRGIVQTTVVWPNEQWKMEPVAGSIGKWYIHRKDARFPLLKLEEPVPAALKQQSSKQSGIALPGLAVLAFYSVFFLSLILLLWLGIPFLSDQAARQLPSDWEISLGRQIRNQTLSSMAEDREKSLILNRLCAGYDFKQDDFDLIKPEFFVVKSSDFNAFAIPGGCIFVHSRAIEKSRNLPELLALIGHENGHVQGRHSLRTLARSLGLYGLISFLLGDLSGLAAIIADNAGSLQTLSYSRDFERDADRAAHLFLCINKVDVRGLPALMETLRNETGNASGSMPSFLSSHPLNEERFENALQLVKNYPCEDLPMKEDAEKLFMELKEK